MHTDMLNEFTINYLNSIDYPVDNDFEFVESFSLEKNEIDIPELNMKDGEFLQCSDSTNFNTDDVICAVHDDNNIYAITIMTEDGKRTHTKIFESLH